MELRGRMSKYASVNMVSVANQREGMRSKIGQWCIACIGRCLRFIVYHTEKNF